MFRVSSWIVLIVVLLFWNQSENLISAQLQKTDRYPLFQHAAVRPLRIRYTLNSGWKFLRADEPEAELATHDDSAWPSINLPHTWNIEDTLDDTPGYYRGTGWYRKNLPLNEKLQGKRLFLYFEGANQVADVYVNGSLMVSDSWNYSFSGFLIR